MCIQELRHSLGVGTVLLHPDLQSLETTQNQEGAERIYHGASHVLQAEHTHFGDKVLLAYHKAGNHIAVAVEVLGSRVHDHISAQLQGILQRGRGKSIVTHHLDVLIVCVGNLCHGIDVGNLQVGVGRGLQIHGTGVGHEMRLHSLQIGSVNEVYFHTVAGHAVI